MKNIQVSVIIPAYNCEKTISKTLESLINQKIKPKEIIIINDGSTDGTELVCKQYANKCGLIKVVSLKKNQGVSHARNVGLKCAEGNYIHFVDADDTVKNNIYSVIIKTLNKETVDCIEFGCTFVSGNDFNIIEERYINKDTLCIDKECIANFLLSLKYSDKERMLNVIWNKIYSKEIIDKNNIRFDEKINLGEDFLFNCQYFAKMSSYFEIKDCLYNYYQNQTNNLTSKFRKDILVRRKKIYSAWIKLYQDYNIYQAKGETYFAKYEGKMLYYSLYTIFSPNCYLNNNEKREFLKEIINDQHSHYIIKYLKFGIEKILIKNKKASVLFSYMKIKVIIKNIIKKKLNRRSYEENFNSNIS